MEGEDKERENKKENRTIFKKFKTYNEFLYFIDFKDPSFDFIEWLN
jgi:hypothetical protein